MTETGAKLVAQEIAWKQRISGVKTYGYVGVWNLKDKEN
jgi:hypothetical protein